MELPSPPRLRFTVYQYPVFYKPAFGLPACLYVSEALEQLTQSDPATMNGNWRCRHFAHILSLLSTVFQTFRLLHQYQLSPLSLAS